MLRHAIVAALIVAGFYAGSTVPDAFIYDDDLLVGQPLAPHSVADLGRVFTEPHYGKLPYYRPLARVTYGAQKALQGDAPRPYRAFNGALAGLILLAAFLLFDDPRFRIRGGPALLAALGFSLHPIASSCVYPITGRETLLPTLFGLLAVVAHLRAGTGWRIAATTLFAAALLSKEQAIAIPLLFLLADLLLRPRASPVEWIRRYAPIGAVIIAYFAIRGAVLTGGPVEIALLDDPGGPLKSLAYGLQTVFWPRVALVYEPPVEASLALWRLLAALVPAAFLVWAAQRSAAPIPRLALFWGAWFVVAQLPSANVLAQETAFDERYVFMASAGFAALVATVVSARWPRGTGRKVALALACVWIVVLAAIGHHRATFFSSGLIFHEQWARTNPASSAAHNGLGVFLARAGRTGEAIEEYAEAIRLRPGNEQAHNNLGTALEQAGESERAVAQLEQALQLHPAYAEAHYNLANTLAGLGRGDEAAAHYRQALTHRWDYTRAHNNYAVLLASRGEIDAALAEFGEVIRLEPSHFRSRLNYGILLARQGRFEEAVSRYREALQIDPASADAHYDMAVALENLSRSNEAAEHYRRALRFAEAAGNARLAAASRDGLSRAGVGAFSSD